jgi:hypothetical protein
MGLIAGTVGAASGFALMITTNMARKVPLSRGENPIPCQLITIYTLSQFSVLSPEPWNHVALALGGYWFGNYYVRLEKQLLLDINEIRADRGLPPLVGAHPYDYYLQK